MARWDDLYELAATNRGFFTAAQAKEKGISRPLLDHHVKAKRVQRVQRGIYRLAHYPASENEDMVVIWLWSGFAGVFSHETALALHELSDALPSKVHVTLPMSWAKRRVKVPELVILKYGDVPQSDRTWSGTLPVTTPARTVLDCVRARTSMDIVRQAIEEGLRRGLFAPEDVAEASNQVGP